MLRVAQWSEEVVPTVAFNFRKVRRGNITLKIWDVAGACCSLGYARSRPCLIGSRLQANRGIGQYGRGIATASTPLCACTVPRSISCVLTIAFSFVVDSSDVRMLMYTFNGERSPPSITEREV